MGKSYRCEQGRTNTTKVLLLVLLSSLVIIPIAVKSITEPPSRTASANCSSCHSSSYYMRVTIITVTAPSNIDVGSQGQVDVKVDVECSHKSSGYAAFSINVALSQQNGRLTLPQSQSLSGQLPGGASAPYAWSRTFSFIVTGSSGGNEVITASAQIDPVHRSPPVTDTATATTTVSAVNGPPTLSQQELAPASGDTGTAFSYSVLYSDPDGDAPEYVRLYVDGTLVSGLTKLEGQGTAYTTGVRYRTSGIKLTEGSHTYSFDASDGSLSSVLPVGSSFDGPIVMGTNKPPVLTNGSVVPITGRPGEEFTFLVDYFDADNDPPSPGVLISISGGPFVAMEVDPSAHVSKRDGAFANGERYRLRTSLDDGDHLFSFNASDGRYHAELGPFTGPLVSAEPTLAVTIEHPVDGARIRGGNGVWLNGTYSLNVPAADTVLDWSSNVSGALGTGERIKVTLSTGHHRISLHANSISNNLTAGTSVDIEVLPDAPVLTIAYYHPAGDVTMDEGSEQTFFVNASSVPPGEIGISWELDDIVVEVGPSEWTYSAGYASAGVHTVACTLTMEDATPLKRSWKVTVRDIPAPIVHTGDITIELGTFSRGDILVLSVDAYDPLGRALIVEWRLDGALTDAISGLLTSVELTGAPFASLGAHMVTATVRNPDGTELKVTFHYTMVGPDPLGADGRGPPDPLLANGTDDGKGRDNGGSLEDWPGLLIIVACSIAAVAKLISVAMVLLKDDRGSEQVAQGPKGPGYGPDEGGG